MKTHPAYLIAHQGKASPLFTTRAAAERVAKATSKKSSPRYAEDGFRVVGVPNPKHPQNGWEVESVWQRGVMVWPKPALRQLIDNPPETRFSTRRAKKPTRTVPKEAERRYAIHAVTTGQVRYRKDRVSAEHGAMDLSLAHPGHRYDVEVTENHRTRTLGVWLNGKRQVARGVVYSQPSKPSAKPQKSTVRRKTPTPLRKAASKAPTGKKEQQTRLFGHVVRTLWDGRAWKTEVLDQFGRLVSKTPRGAAANHKKGIDFVRMQMKEEKELQACRARKPIQRKSKKPKGA
jgi:hypothetical protein